MFAETSLQCLYNDLPGCEGVAGNSNMFDFLGDSLETFKSLVGLRDVSMSRRD